MVTPLRRPTTVAEYRQSMENFSTEEGRLNYQTFQAQPTDIFISPYAKSGTTWLQQIVHGLRTRGSMDFEEISGVVPWLELSYDLGIDVHGPQVAEPRVFKSHLTWKDIPKGATSYICSIRNPKDVLVSMFRFLEGWQFETDSIPISTFARELFMENPKEEGYWRHLASWWAQRDNPDVLLLCYETMKTDLPGTIEIIADFIGVQLDDALYQIVLKQSSLDFMLAHKTQFDEHLTQRARDAACGIPPGGDAAKVRNGRVGDHKQALSQAIIDELDNIWREEIAPRFNLETYEDLQEALTLIRSH